MAAAGRGEDGSAWSASAAASGGVALTPPGVALVARPRFRGGSLQAGAGWGAWHSDDAYRAEGAEILDGPEFAGASDILVCVAPPDRGYCAPARLSSGCWGPSATAPSPTPAPGCTSPRSASTGCPAR
ncbi:hypothetical protein GCM10020218_058160 [Dactylosporangium vinaceum]